MKRQYVIIIVAMLCLSVLAACGPKAGSQDPVPAESLQPQTEVQNEVLPETSEALAETTETTTEPTEAADTESSTEATTGLPEWESIGGNSEFKVQLFSEKRNSLLYFL